jgi:hypothetical protein
MKHQGDIGKGDRDITHEISWSNRQAYQGYRMEWSIYW